MDFLQSTLYEDISPETSRDQMDLPQSTGPAIEEYARTSSNLMNLPPSTSYAFQRFAGTSQYPFSAVNRQGPGSEESVSVDNDRLIKKLREVLSINILEENTEYSPKSDTERDSQVLLSEVYVESPSLLGTKKCLEPSPEDNNFFEFSKAILLGNETSFSLEDFVNIRPDIKITARVFLHFICVDNKHCTDPKLLMKFLTVIAAMFSNSKLVLNVRQVSLIVKFLLHCLFVEINHVKHGEFRLIVAQMLNMFTNGSSITSKRLYTDIVEYFNTKVKYFPLDLYHWSAIFLTVELMGVSAIQSIIIPNFSAICKLLDESLKSLESYNCKMIVSIFKQTTEENAYSESQESEIKKFNCAMKTYLDAANVRALLLKLCAILIEAVIKEDIKTEKRMIYIPKEIDDLLERGEIVEPELIKYKFSHEKHKLFFKNCFQYFGDALNAHILSVFIEYERSNYIKADFFKQKYELYPIENRYSVFEKPCEQKKLSKSRKCSKSNDKPQTVLKIEKKIETGKKTLFLTHLGSILATFGEGKDLSEKDARQKLKVLAKKEPQCYLASLLNVPEPWIRVLRKRYESQHRVQPKHWRFTGNLETYI